jgi:oxygen-dependent protoporphyrinogen oxidase
MELNREEKPSIQITLLESSSRLGGVIQTTKEEGFLFEEGPDSFLLDQPWANDLCERLGLEDHILRTQTENRRSFVLRQGCLHPIPDGFFLLAPARIRPFVKTSIFSWPGKARMMLDLILPRKKSTEDESLASFVTRRLGKEALVRMAQPLVGGIYTADPEKLSMKAVLPRLLKMEEDYGSILLGMRREAKLTNRQGSAPGGARYSLFVSLRDGMKTLVDTLAERLPKESLRFEAFVTQVEHTPSSGTWRVGIKNGPSLEFDAVVLALPSWEASRLLEGFCSSLAKELGSVPYASSAVVNLAYHRKDIPHPLDGFGFVVPSAEKRSMIACSFSSVKFAARAPSNSALLRAFVGGALQPELVELDNDTLERCVRQDLQEILGIRNRPRRVLITRHHRSMPQYEVGHLSLVERIEKRLQPFPGLALTGNAYHGIGIPDCIHSGEVAAESTVTHLRSKGNKTESC